MLSTIAFSSVASGGCVSDAVVGALGSDEGSGGSGPSVTTSEATGTAAGASTAATGSGSGESSTGADGGGVQGSWSVISQNTLSDVDPCSSFPCAWSGFAGQVGVLDFWNGAAFAADLGAEGRLLAWGGGGASGYYGNELYAFDVADGVWSRLTDPVENIDGVVAEFGEFEDGSPIAFQNNDSLAYDPAQRALVLLNGSSTVVGQAQGTGHRYDFSTERWQRTPVFPNTTGLASSAYDATRGLVWAHPQGGGLFAYDPRGGPDADGRYGTIAALGPNFASAIYSVAAIDPELDLYVLLDAADGRLYGIALDSPLEAPTELRVGGDAPDESGGGFEWARGRFYWYAGFGNDIRTLTPPAGDWAEETWRWDPVTVTGGTPPEPRETPVFSSWQWAPAIESFVICNGVDAPVRAFRI